MSKKKDNKDDKKVTKFHPKKHKHQVGKKLKNGKVKFSDGTIA